VSLGIEVSIIIVSWNVSVLLRPCLRSLFEAGGLPAGRFEVIVVDNDSRDGTVAMLREEFPWVEVVANRENVGFAAAHNQVLTLCRGEILLLLNPDTVVAPGALATLVERLRKTPGAGIVGPRLLNSDGSLQKWTGGAFPRLRNVAQHYLFLDRVLPGCLRTAPLYLDHDRTGDTEVDWVSGACLVIWRELAGERLFDPNYFMYGEDMELCFRVKQGGRRVVYSPAASIVHHQGASIKQQQGDILLSSLKGLRFFYAATQGRRKLWIVDLLTVVGFFLRALLFGMAMLAGVSGAEGKASSSWGYMKRAIRVLGTSATW